MIDMVGEIRIVTCPCGCNIAFTTTNKRKQYLNEAHKARRARDRAFEANWRDRLPQDVLAVWRAYRASTIVPLAERAVAGMVIGDLVLDHNLYMVARLIQAFATTCCDKDLMIAGFNLTETIADMRVGRRVKADSKVIQSQQLRNMAE